jgi:hypothetical protein
MSAGQNAERPIAGRFRLDPGRPPLALASGVRAFWAADPAEPGSLYLALPTPPEMPLRPRVIPDRPAPDRVDPVPHAVLPLALGEGVDPAGQSRVFTICPPLPGPSLAEERHVWREGELLGCVLQPAALALDALRARGLTHRAIRPENMFRAGPGEKVVLGPFWEAPAASTQPPLFEPPYSACCVPAGRGEGSVADDVYALGVTLLVLATGRLPMAGLVDAEALRRKLELGSFAALAGDTPLPAVLADLLRGMLAEDPDHRPTPAMLLEPMAARARRVAARPPRRAQRPIGIMGANAWTGRELAHALGLHPDAGAHALRSGAVDHWLRRALADPQAALRLEEALRLRTADAEPAGPRANALLVMRAVAVLDPLAPVCWGGLCFWPDGLGPALATAPPDQAEALLEAVGTEAVGQWAGLRQERCDAAGLRQAARDWRRWLTTRPPGGGPRRLLYALNPLLACASPLLQRVPVLRIADLLPGLERVAAEADTATPPMDAHLAAFIAARGDTALQMEAERLAGEGEPAATLRLFVHLQSRLSPEPCPALAGWLIASGAAGLERWRNRARRAALHKQLEALAAKGQLQPILALADNEAGLAADQQAAAAARERLQALGRQIDLVEQGAKQHDTLARRIGQELAALAGLAAALAATFRLVLS